MQELLFLQRTSAGIVFSDMTFNWCISLIETPPIPFPHLNDLVSFLSYVISTHLVLFSFLYYALNICITQTKSCFLTRTIVTITSHSFKNSVTKIANSVYTETISLLLSTSGTFLSNLQSGRGRWKYDKTTISKECDLFWRGVKRCMSLSYSHLV